MKRLLTLWLLIICFVPVSFGQRFYNQKIVGYIPSYGYAANVDYTNLTHAMFAFITPTINGGITSQNPGNLNAMNTFLTKTLAAGTTRLISVGTTNFSSMAANPAAIAIFADTLRKYCLHYGFDGVDIDWESLSSAAERTNYDAVMTALEASLKPANLLLVCTVGFGNYWGQWYPTTGLQKADWLQIMVYDQTGTWASSPFGNHSTYQHLLSAETYWTGRGFTKDKLVMGVPFYGYKFASTSGGTGTARSYANIVSSFPSMTDDQNQTPGSDYTCFNGPALIRQKCQYLIDNSFAGIMVWEMTQDATGDKSLHKQIICTYSNTACVTNLPLAINHFEDQKTFDLFMTHEGLVIKSDKNISAEIYFYDLSGKLISKSNSISLNEGMNTISTPESIEGLFICKLLSDQHFCSKKLYK